MRVELDKFIIGSDQYQYSLHVKRVATQGKNKGKETVALVGYYPKFDQLVMAAVRTGLSCNTVRTLSDINKTIESVAAELDAAINKE